MKQLDILVVDDNKDHQYSARRLLAEHNLTLVGNGSEAAECLAGKFTRKIPKQRYDVLLTDLNLPMGNARQISKPEKFAGQEFGYGYPLLLLALAEKTPYIGLLSNADHHADPMADVLYYFNQSKLNDKGDEVREKTFKIGESICAVVGWSSQLYLLDDRFVSMHGSHSEPVDGGYVRKGSFSELNGSRFTDDYVHALAEQNSSRIKHREGEAIGHKNWKAMLDTLLAAK